MRRMNGMVFLDAAAECGPSRGERQGHTNGRLLARLEEARRAGVGWRGRELLRAELERKRRKGEL